MVQNIAVWKPHKEITNVNFYAEYQKIWRKITKTLVITL